MIALLAGLIYLPFYLRGKYPDKIWIGIPLNFFIGSVGQFYLSNSAGWFFGVSSVAVLLKALLKHVYSYPQEEASAIAFGAGHLLSVIIYIIRYNRLMKKHNTGAPPAIDSADTSTGSPVPYVFSEGQKDNAQKSNRVKKYAALILFIAIITGMGFHAYNNMGVTPSAKDVRTNFSAGNREDGQPNTNDARAYWKSGYAWIKKRDLDRAIADFNKAIEINPNYAEAYYGRGTAYILQENEYQGCRDLQKACELGRCKVLETAKSKGVCL